MAVRLDRNHYLPARPLRACLKRPSASSTDAFLQYAGAEDCQALEQLCRTITRPVLANESVQPNAAGQVVLKLKTAWRDGATRLVMSPLYLTPPHGKVDLLKSLLANIHAALRHFKAAAEQIKSTDRWVVLLRYISDKIAPLIGPFRLPQALPGPG